MAFLSDKRPGTGPNHNSQLAEQAAALPFLRPTPKSRDFVVLVGEKPTVRNIQFADNGKPIHVLLIQNELEKFI